MRASEQRKNLFEHFNLDNSFGIGFGSVAWFVVVLVRYLFGFFSSPFLIWVSNFAITQEKSAENRSRRAQNSNTQELCAHCKTTGSHNLWTECGSKRESSRFDGRMESRFVGFVMN